jgi:hypothetical protein
MTATEKWKTYLELIRDEKFSLLYVLQCAYSISKSTKEIFSVALSKHVTHYDPRAGFPYFNLATHLR